MKSQQRRSLMSMVSEDLLDLDWMDYEGVIGMDPITHKYEVQLNRRLHWFDTRKEAEEYLVTHGD